MVDTTTIEISRENWQGLNRRKRPGDSFDDVISRLLAGEIESGGDQEEPSGDGIPVECSECGHEWTYGGGKTSGQYITCSACKSNLKL